ncbi:MAG: hypothetical protein ACOY58_04530 [Candidatus Micrarchaeota archaeon]
MRTYVWQRRGLTYVILGGGVLHGLARMRKGDKWDADLGFAIACLKALLWKKLDDQDRRLLHSVESIPPSERQLTDGQVGQLLLFREGLQKALANQQELTSPTASVYLIEQAGRGLLTAWFREAELARSMAAPEPMELHA